MNTSKTVFIEYSTAQKGQHFMTVLQVEDGKRVIIGRIYREYDQESKKPTYEAKDWDGNPVFTDTSDLYTLKKKFIESGKTMSLTIPRGTARVRHDVKMPHVDRTNRAKELNTIRKGYTPKVKEKEEPERIPEKIPDNTDRTNPRDPDFDSPPGTEQGQGFEVPFEEKSERDMELENIRDQNLDNERDPEMDRDL